MRKNSIPCVISLIVEALYNIVDQRFSKSSSPTDMDFRAERIVKEYGEDETKAMVIDNITEIRQL